MGSAAPGAGRLAVPPGGWGGCAVAVGRRGGPCTDIASYAPAGPTLRRWEIPVLGCGRGAREAVTAGVCNQCPQLASAPDGLKGSAIKHRPTLPFLSHPSVSHQLDPFRLRRWQSGPAAPRG